MDISKEQIIAEIKEKQEGIKKISSLMDTLRDSRSRLLGQIDYLQDLLKKETPKIG